jgi:hypothetical protein
MQIRFVPLSLAGAGAFALGVSESGTLADQVEHSSGRWRSADFQGSPDKSWSWSLRPG